MKKIIIIGSPGAGKSTLSRELSSILSIDLYHMDKLFWKPDWVSVSREELEEKLSQVVNKDSWIIDGNYLNTMDMRIERADTIIFLDYPLWLCLWGVFKRRFEYSKKTRPDITEGCKENLNFEFLKFVVNFSRNQRKEVYEKLENLNNEKTIYIFKNRKSLKSFLMKVK